MSVSGAWRLGLQVGALRSLMFLPWVRSANSSGIGRTDAEDTPEVGRMIGPLKSLGFRRMALFCRFANALRIARVDAVGRRPSSVAGPAH